MSAPTPRIALTSGEPAGIGPDLCIALAASERRCEVVTLGDPGLLADRARQLGAPVSISEYDPAGAPRPAASGRLLVLPVPLAEPAVPGELNPANGASVLQMLERAGRGCLAGEFAAVVTAPVQKSTITDSGTPFSGHTEYFAELCQVPLPVMLLCTDELRVALVTTHLPLRAVPDAITRDRVEQTGRILHRDLQRRFGIARPRIAVLGLNPHAGESGQLGNEDAREIEPAVAALRADGIIVSDPLPADSAFTQKSLANFDAVLAMYHDQGLPVLKHAGFGRAVNVTLGLPIIRTSVDHGTALDLAATGKADAGSLNMALAMARQFAERAAS